MNEILLEKNLTLLSKRFEHLYKALLPISKDTHTPCGIEIIEAKNKELSATYDNAFLHSAYNPSAEAKKLMQTSDVCNAESIVFFGFGLGYSVIECARQHKNKTIIVIEPNLQFVLLAFSTMDWTDVFAQESLVLLFEAPQQTVITILEHYGLNDCFFIAQNAIMQHALPYFTNLQTLIQRNKDKQAINMRTLERFSKLWLSNMCKNISHVEALEGIMRYEKKAENLQACVLAAGPSLDAVLPYLAEIKKRCILICVDTALRACLNAGVEPHFILLIDPQYWNARHIEGLQSPESILITESAAYPSVFRFKCKEIILCSSLFPLGKYIENFSSPKGELAPGGSVATSAWDFARFIGCKSIYMAGLDLSFPNKKTHTKGSTFEEKLHMEAKKTSTVETALSRVLYNKHTEKSVDYNGKATITDARMKLYAWWFESKCMANPQVKTFSLSNESLAIPGIQPIELQNLLQLMQNTVEIQKFVNIQSTEKKELIPGFIQKSLLQDFSALEEIIDNGIRLCKRRYTTDVEYEKVLKKLNDIDCKIATSTAKDVVSLVFPSPDQLREIEEKELPQKPLAQPKSTFKEGAQHNIQKSQLIYNLIKKGIDLHIYYLLKNT